jgi:hypothetical protein
MTEKGGEEYRYELEDKKKGIRNKTNRKRRAQV